VDCRRGALQRAPATAKIDRGGEVSATLRFDNIGKVFPGVRALDGVSFDVNVGQVHGLMGENGAGKSTLLKILGGEYQPDSGRVMIDGKEVRFTSAASSIAAGIAVIHQELQYVPDLTVAENLLLGQLPNSFGWVNKRDAKRFVRERLEAMGVALDPDAKLRKLSPECEARALVDRATANGRNLQGAAAQCARHRARRTDEFAVASRDRGAVQAGARSARRQPRDDLHLASHGRNLRIVRRLHDLSRRAQGRLACDAARRVARHHRQRNGGAGNFGHLQLFAAAAR